MLRFNNNHIFTGYLKQLLASFNLPKYRVYTKENQRNYDETGHEVDIVESVLVNKTRPHVYSAHVRYIPYIKDDKIQIYASKEKGQDPEWIWLQNNFYNYNQRYLNHTKTLQIKNNIYDEYTHKYLGDFLRFWRDYLDLDLMSMYNCFTNEICNNLNLVVKDDSTGEVKANFNSADSNYKIYMLPVKMFKSYTIAIESTDPVEICCGLYGAYQDTREAKDVDTIYELTYQKYSGMQFSSPIVYDKLTQISELMSKDNATELATIEQDLKMFIKLPAGLESSIVVLEGTYPGCNQSTYSANENKQYEVSTNRWITNFEYPESVEIFNPVSTLQLLKINTGVSYPFADRLIEYLVFNAICELDSYNTPDNVRRVQKVMSENKIPIIVDGAWDTKYRPILYDYLYEHKLPYVEYTDTLGYVDKDVEALYKSNHKAIEDDKVVYETINTLNAVDIYADEEVHHYG